MTIVLSDRAAGRSLVSKDLFSRLARHLVREEKLDRDLAERIVDQALAFLVACAKNEGQPLAPSGLVDLGWHTFLLHTRDYDQFCQRVAGRYLHHVPLDDSEQVTREIGRAALLRTVVAIRRAGFVVDRDLWPKSAVETCTGCHNGCHDDPPPVRQ